MTEIELARGADREPLAEALGAQGFDVRERRHPCRLGVEGATAEELGRALEGWVPPDEATLVAVRLSKRRLALRPAAG